MQSIPIIVFYVLIALMGVTLILVGHFVNKWNKSKMTTASNTINVKKKIVKKEKRLDFDKFLDKFWFVIDAEKRITPTIKISTLPITARTITKARIWMVIIAIIFSLLLKNAFIVIPISIMLYQIPFSLVKRKANKREAIFGEQLLENFQMFVTDFTSTRNVQETVYNMSKKSKEPLRSEWTLLNANLSSGVSPEQSFVTFADRIGNKWARIFAQIMISYYNTGTSFSEQLMSLTTKMTDEKVAIQENQTEISSMRTLVVILNLCVPVCYIFNRIVQPDTAKIFTDTTSGRMIIFAITLMCMLSLWLSKKIAEW